MVYNRAGFTFRFSISKFFSSNVRAWPYFLFFRSIGSSQEPSSESTVSAIMVYTCKFQGCACSCTDQRSILSTQKFYNMHLILTGHAVKKTTNNICQQPRAHKFGKGKCEWGGCQSGCRTSMRGWLYATCLKKREMKWNNLVFITLKRV